MTNFYNIFPSQTFIYIYTNKEMEKKNIFFINVAPLYIIDEIFKINKNLKLYIYTKILYDIDTDVNIFLQFLSLIIHDYKIILKNLYKLVFNESVKCEGIKLVEIIQQLLINFKKL